MHKNPDWGSQAARLKWARVTAKVGSARGVAQARGWPLSTYITHENGTRLKKGLSEDDARKYARAFRVDVGWLMTGIGEPRPKAWQQPGQAVIIGKVGAGAKVYAVEADEGWPVDDIPEEITESCDLFEIEGASMLPLFQDRDILAVERRHYTPMQLIGRLAFVQLENGERYVKTLRRGSDTGVFDLESLNAPVIPDAEVVSAGRIKWVRFAA